MYIIVRDSDSVIIGSAVKPVSEEQMKNSGKTIYEIEDHEFSPQIIGQRITELEII